MLSHVIGRRQVVKSGDKTAQAGEIEIEMENRKKNHGNSIVRTERKNVKRA